MGDPLQANRQPAEHLDLEAEEAERRGVSLRAIGLGLFLSVAVGVLGNTVRFVQHGSYMAFSHIPMGNLILFLLSLLVLAMLARLFGQRFVFSQTEWITVFSMGYIGSFGPTYGMSGQVVGILAAPYYFATPENRWAEFIHPYLPRWLIPGNETDAMT